MAKNLIIIGGPTAVGKTALGVWLAKQLKTEVISADSRQIYKEMFIGTARPTEEEMQGVPHHFIGVRSVKEYYNAYIYEQDVLALLERLFERYENVLMVGGSGLYIDAVVRGIDLMPSIKPEIRQMLLQKLETQGIAALYQMLQDYDPDYYQRVNPNDKARILKALEVSLQTGKPYSSFLTGKPKQRDFNIIMLGLEMPRQQLYERINKRVLEMIDRGLVQEAKELYPLRSYTALNTVGYKEIFAYLEGKYSLDVAVSLIQRNTRNYARRQIAWFRRYKELEWFKPWEKTAILRWLENKIG